MPEIPEVLGQEVCCDKDVGATTLPLFSKDNPEVHGRRRQSHFEGLKFCIGEGGDVAPDAGLVAAKGNEILQPVVWNFLESFAVDIPIAPLANCHGGDFF